MSAYDTTALTRTVQALEAGLHVRHIATYDLTWCDVTTPIEEVFADPRFAGFDCVPVREGFAIVGVYRRSRSGEHEQATGDFIALDDTNVVSADLPLHTFLMYLADSSFWMVRTGTAVNGIVTRSDLLKLPVRMLAFMMVTHLEMTMAAIIEQHAPNDGWLVHLKESRQERLEAKFENLQQQRVEITRLEASDFCDKRTAVRRLLSLPGKFEDDLRRVETLRNDVAHANSYTDATRGIQDFLTSIQLTNTWIRTLDTHLSLA